MDNIELRPVSPQFLKHENMVREIVLTIRVRPESCGTSLYQSCIGTGIATGKKRHSVSETNQFLGQPRNNALCSTISRRWNTFIERRNQGNSHVVQRVDSNFLIVRSGMKPNYREDAVACYLGFCLVRLQLATSSRVNVARCSRSTCLKVQSRGALSGRQRRNLVPCRKRPPVK